MTDYRDVTEDQMVEYMRELRSMEDAGHRVTVTIGPYAGMMLIGLLQLASRHPDMPREAARDFVRQLEPLYTGTIGEEIIRRGAHPEFDR